MGYAPLGKIKTLTVHCAATPEGRDNTAEHSGYLNLLQYVIGFTGGTLDPQLVWADLITTCVIAVLVPIPK